MARWGVVAGIVGAGVALGFWVGPREFAPPPNLQTPPVPKLDELEDWIAASEARHGPTPGTEKRVLWADGEVHRRTPWSVIYVHGYSATRQELAPVPERVAARLGANLFETRLTGHGLPGTKLAEATADAWIRDYREAIRVGYRLGERVALLGVSTGATIDAYVSMYGVEGPDAHLWISPNFGPKSASAELLLWPWARVWVPWVAGTERSWEPANEAQGRYWTTRYPVEALFPMQALVQAARSGPLAAIDGPTFVVHSSDDEVIDPKAVRTAFENIGANPKKRLELSGASDAHVLAGEILSPENTDRLVDDLTAWLATL
ncbi:MAG: alpha/beta hydrolase [Myxococcota bacterium]